METKQVVLPAQRAAARSRKEPPRRDPAFADLDLAIVRRMRKGLIEEEARVSYWRRIIQARIDLLRSHAQAGAHGQRLARVLADARGSHRRIAALSIDSAADLPPLPDLAELWNRVVPNDADERLRLVEALTDGEKRLSDYRHSLHARIDRVTAELIARYRENPTLALTALHERLAQG